MNVFCHSSIKYTVIFITSSEIQPTFVESKISFQDLSFPKFHGDICILSYLWNFIRIHNYSCPIKSHFPVCLAWQRQFFKGFLVRCTCGGAGSGRAGASIESLSMMCATNHTPALKSEAPLIYDLSILYLLQAFPQVLIHVLTSFLRCRLPWLSRIKSVLGVTVISLFYMACLSPQWPTFLDLSSVCDNFPSCEASLQDLSCLRCSSLAFLSCHFSIFNWSRYKNLFLFLLHL